MSSVLRTVLQNVFRRKPALPPSPDIDLASFTPGASAFDLPPAHGSPSASTLVGTNVLFGDRAEPVLETTTAVPQNTTQTGNYVVLGTLDQVRAYVQNPPPRSTSFMLTGELVILAGQADVAKIDHYHRQTDRIVKSLRGFARGKRHTPFTLKVWLHEDVVALKRALPRHKFCFALDQYLAYGRRQGTSIHLVTGYSADATIIHIFTFDNGTLTDILEKNLPAASHPRFAADFTTLLSGFNRNGHTVTVASPLPQTNLPSCAYVGESIYAKPIAFFINDETASPSLLVRHGLTIVLLILAIAGYVATIALPYDDYSDATSSFQRIAASIPKDDLAFGSDQLKTMQERNRFLTAERQQSTTVAYLRGLTSALSSQGVIIRSLALNRVKAPDRPKDPDVSIRVEVKRSPNESVYDQAKPILDHLSQRMGMDFHLAHGGYQERATADGKTITYTIEGNFKSGATS